LFACVLDSYCNPPIFHERLVIDFQGCTRIRNFNIERCWPRKGKRGYRQGEGYRRVGLIGEDNVTPVQTMELVHIQIGPVQSERKEPYFARGNLHLLREAFIIQSGEVQGSSIRIGQIGYDVHLDRGRTISPVPESDRDGIFSGFQLAKIIGPILSIENFDSFRVG